MADLNWCTFCDKAVSPFSESLYCSEQCLRADALRNHPLLGYTYPEFIDFPRKSSATSSSASSLTTTSLSSISTYSSPSTSPALSASSPTQFSSPPKFDLSLSFKKKSDNAYFSSFRL